MTRIVLAHAKKIKLTHAMKDKQALIREQNKYEMTKNVGAMSQDYFRAVLGR
jgi:hypothetical protein